MFQNSICSHKYIFGQMEAVGGYFQKHKMERILLNLYYRRHKLLHDCHTNVYNGNFIHNLDKQLYDCQWYTYEADTFVLVYLKNPFSLHKQQIKQ